MAVMIYEIKIVVPNNHMYLIFEKNGGTMVAKTYKMIPTILKDLG
jgi:hypothetical protein